ncbi:MAG TPA: hypothetical protein VJS92_18480 [Candidatus Polarisedimenticolaceae bacterium]|nr:hypothetical protein [Candidatus Polarisedimenticolaceae bacterium]
MKRLVSTLVAVLSLTAAVAATPVPLVNYEGVLRDAAGNPITGSRDMLFRLFNAAGSGCPPSGGLLLLEDDHSGVDAVAVNGGLFNVAIGGGDIAPASALTLQDAFRFQSAVWLEVWVAGEALCPRVQFLTAPGALNALNATLLDNLPRSNFLDTSASSQTKAGSLTLQGGDLQLGPVDINASATQFTIQSDSNTDTMLLQAGNDYTDGSLFIRGDNEVQLWSGNGVFQFFDGTNNGVVASIFANGDLQIGSQLIFLGIGGPTIQSQGLGLKLAGGADSSDLSLWAGNDVSDGGIEISGDSTVALHSGNGQFSFNNGSSGAETAALDALGDLELDGDLTAQGGDLYFTAAGAADTRISTDSGGDIDAVAHQDVEVMIDRANDGTVDWFRIYHDNAFVNTSLLAEVHENGNLRVRGTITGNVNFDLAETFLMGEPLEPGDVVRVDPGRGDAVRRATAADGGTVIGVVSAAPGVLLGGGFLDRPSLDVWGPQVAARFDAERTSLEAQLVAVRPALADSPAKLESSLLQEFARRNFAPIALAGRVRVKADASFGAIAVGDGLAASSLPGVAMRAAQQAGTTIGTALEPLTEGRGTVLMLVGRGGTAPPAPETASAGHVGVERVELRAQPREDETSTTKGVPAERAIRENVSELTTPARVAEPVEPGDVLVLDPAGSGGALLARDGSNPAVLGVVAAPGSASGALVSIAGVVTCKVDAGYGAIRPGDLLTSSPTPGHAMRADDPRPGTVLGKALQPLESGMGTIAVLVMLR